MILPVFNYSLTQWNGIAATWVNACSKTSDENYRSLFPVFGLASKFDDAELERMGLCPKICHFLNILSWGYWGYWFRTNADFFRIGRRFTTLFGFANRGKSRFYGVSSLLPLPHYTLFISPLIFPTSSPHRDTRSAQRACRRAAQGLWSFWLPTSSLPSSILNYGITPSKQSP